MSLEQFPNWVPDDTVGTRKETATLIVGTAKEFNLTVRHHVASTRGGFYISDELANVLYDDSAEDETEPEEDEVSGNEKPASTKTAKKSSTKKTSGNRAAKTSNKE